MILLILGLIPLVGSIVVGVLPATRVLLAKQLTLAFSLATLGVAIGMCIAFDANAGERFQFTVSTSWIRSFGASFALGVDGIALVLIALVAVLVPAVVLASWHEASPGLPAAAAATTTAATTTAAATTAAGATGPVGTAGGGTATATVTAPVGTATADGPVEPGVPARRSPKVFFALLLLLEVMLVGVFAATDVLLFYVFFEAMLIPMYFLIGSFGGPRRQYAAVKFFLYSLLGGLLMLAAVIGLYVTAGKGTFAFESLIGAITDPGTQKLLFLGFFVAFAIKAPLVPFHTWLPDAGAEAPIGGAALLVGVLDKVGTFGFIGLGIFAFTTQGMSGAVFYMVNHGLSTGALFLVVGVLIARGGSRLVSDYGGVARVAPMLGGFFLLAGLSSLALPGMSTFVSEFLVLVGTFTRHRWYAVVATAGIIFAAIYILLLVQRTMHGPTLERVRAFRDLSGREVWALAPLLALVIFLGVYPKPVLDVITPAVQRTMQDAHQSDPAPTVGVSAEQKAGNR